ncbi:unnamed protein product [Lepeophtheirus salmonis]|uniref:(salmon louse) hypothetical protein n=1 Tax=Lepeophtheirus salmonis TaxID=72036 RepID=A0A7R8HAJ3_LEPSM|nr:unnamed protein product [Lepeophtheirus salmonis]CAF2976406.1 unnamed protein product [Lepeophtheirus salmonis]
MRTNRIENCSLLIEKELSWKGRGSYNYKSENDGIIVLRGSIEIYKDNKGGSFKISEVPNKSNTPSTSSARRASVSPKPEPSTASEFDNIGYWPYFLEQKNSSRCANKNCGSNQDISPVEVLNCIRLLMLGKQAEFDVPSDPVKCRNTNEETQDMPPFNQLGSTSISKEDKFEHHNSEDCIYLSMALINF